jgi:hypothetical protein
VTPLCLAQRPARVDPLRPGAGQLRFELRLIRMTEWRGEVDASSADAVLDALQTGLIAEDDETVTGNGWTLRRHTESITMELPPERPPEQ